MPVLNDVSARSVPLASLPVIDVGGLRTGDRSSRARVARSIREASLNHGFFYISNHGIADGLIAAVLNETRGFFALPLAEKLAVSRDLSPCGRGYEPMGGQALDEGTPPDQKEAFDLGREPSEHDLEASTGSGLDGSNQWPGALVDFRPTMRAYIAAMTELSSLLLEAVAASLGLAENHFEGLCRDATIYLRLLHYPPRPAAKPAEGKGAGAHTDWGALTLLWQDEVGGLELLDGSNSWIHVPPIPGCYVVNLGDLIARWTNDLYRSTVHRVINRSVTDRYSIPFFLDGNPDYRVECLPGCSSPDNPPRYVPITVAAHTAEKYRAASTRAPAK